MSNSSFVYSGIIIKTEIRVMNEKQNAQVQAVGAAIQVVMGIVIMVFGLILLF